MLKSNKYEYQDRTSTCKAVIKAQNDGTLAKFQRRIPTYKQALKTYPTLSFDTKFRHAKKSSETDEESSEIDLKRPDTDLESSNTD